MKVELRQLGSYIIIALAVFISAGCRNRTVVLSMSQPRPQLEEQLKLIDQGTRIPRHGFALDYQWNVELVDYDHHIMNLLFALQGLSIANTANYLRVGDERILFEICPSYCAHRRGDMMVIDVKREGLFVQEVIVQKQVILQKQWMKVSELERVIRELHIEQIFLQIADDADGSVLFSFLCAIRNIPNNIFLYLTNWHKTPIEV
ncbi:MAG: hypothetical protein ACI4QJ_07115 [Candidatus Spyradenecus sp.]